MVQAFLIVLGSNIIGISILPNRFFKSFVVFGFGISSWICLGASMSNFTGAPLGKTMKYVLILSILVVLIKFCISNTFRSRMFPYVISKLSILLGVTLVFSYIVTQFKFDFAVRNFDAYYAAQDGAYLSGHAAFERTSAFHGLLPLTWSASTNDRYGVSYLLAFLKYVNLGSTWANAQYVMLVCLICLVFLIYEISKLLFSNELLIRYFALLLTIFSAALLVPVINFMFGQVLGLCVVFTSILLIGSQNKDSLPWGAICFSSTLIVIYPAMIFPMVLFWAVLVFLLQYKKSLVQTLLIGVRMAFAFVFLSLILFGFHFSVLWDRIWVWVAGNLNLDNGSTDNTLAGINFYGQYGSKIGLPLFFGLLRYPFTSNLNLFQIMFLLLVTAFAVVLIYFSINSSTNLDFKRILIAFCVSWVGFGFGAYLFGKSYIFAKFSTWTLPVLTLIIISGIMPAYRILTKRFFGLVKFFFIFFVVSLLGLTATTSLSYFKDLARWNSFPNTPDPKNYEFFKHYVVAGTDRVLLLAPTAEEATWTAALFESFDPKRLLPLGADKQALGAAFSSNCTLSKSQVEFKSNDFIVQNVSTLDIVPKLNFASAPVRLIGSYSIQSANFLKSGIVLNGDGLMPPTAIANFANVQTLFGSLRWSSGHLCAAIYSNAIENKKLVMNFQPGPDLQKMLPWEIMFNGGAQEIMLFKDRLETSIEVQKGWNLIDFVQPGCSIQPESNASRWNARADDRKLCIAITGLQTLQS